MTKRVKRIASGCVAVALAALIAFGGIGPAAVQAAPVNPDEINLEDVTVEDIKAALESVTEEDIEAFVADVEENYDTYYAEAYQYAKENGYLSATTDALAKAKEALLAFDVDSLDVKDEYKAELPNLIENAIETIDELTAFIETADVLDDETYAAAVELLGKLGQNLTDIREALTPIAKDAGAAAWEAYEEALEIYETEIKPAILEGLHDAYEYGKQKVEEAIEALVAEIEKAIDEAVAEIEAQLKAQLEKLQAELEKAVDEAKAAIEAEIAKIEAALEALVDLKNDLEATVAEKIAAIEAAIAATQATIEKTIADIEAMVKECELVIKDFMAGLDESVRGAIEDAMEAAANAGEDLDAFLAALDTALAAIIAEYEAAYEDATHGEYDVDEDSYYVAIGDSVIAGAGTYEEILAAELAEVYGVEAGQAFELDGFRAEDIRALLDDTYATDAYGQDLDTSVAEGIVEEIAKADLITVSLGNDNFTSYVTAQIQGMLTGEAYELDWAACVGEEGVAVVDEMLAEVYAAIVAEGVPTEAIAAPGLTIEDPAQLMTDIVEVYAYAFATFSTNYAEALNAIHAINPDAEVVVVGMYNPIDAAAMEGVVLGEYVDYFVELSNQMFAIYAMVTPNTTFVEVPATTTDADDVTDILAYVYALTGLMPTLYDYADYLPNAEGQAYIKDQILDAMTITKAPVEEADDEVVQIWGKNRFKTAIGVADQIKADMGIDEFDTIIVATGMEFADALSGSYLAYVKTAPILLINEPNAEMVTDYINANLAEDGKVYVLGGTAAVADEWLAGIDTDDIQRLKGKSRIETNLAILEEAGVEDGEILVCTGLVFADSLSASSAKAPIFLVNGDTLKDVQKEFLAGLTDDTYTIIGGDAAVSEAAADVIAEYGDVERVKGKNRYETSIAVAERFVENPETAVVAYGLNFPDGLCGGLLATANDAAIILSEDSRADIAAEYMAANGIKAGYVLGGDGCFADATIAKIFGIDVAEIVKKRTQD